MTGLAIIVGASVVAITMADVFAQFTFAMELPILFAAPFWIGMYWRRANRAAVWITIAFSTLFFFVLPIAVPQAFPGMQTDPQWTTTTNLVTKTIRRTATAADVARHEAWVEATKQADGDVELLKKIGPQPPNCAEGDQIDVVLKSGDKSIFWSRGVSPIGDEELEDLGETTEDNVKIVSNGGLAICRATVSSKLTFCCTSSWDTTWPMPPRRHCKRCVCRRVSCCRSWS